jgi:hypothetical protein
VLSFTDRLCVCLAQFLPQAPVGVLRPLRASGRGRHRNLVSGHISRVLRNLVQAAVNQSWVSYQYFYA